MNQAIENMKTRRSVRKFKADAVPQELIGQVIEAGTFAASGHDRQPWAVIAVTDEDVRRRLSQVNASFFDMDVKDPFYGAPVVIIVLVKKRTPTYLYDGTLCIGNMMLAAHSLGLASCWIHRARQTFELPEWQEWLAGVGLDMTEEWEGVGHVALGYAAGDLPVARPRKEGRVFYVK
ncbi:NADH dehydrogenase [Bacteroidaceae bacterium]|nr:oxygen-insensitive NAD(P)H nitroreductase [Prevotella sp. MGM2]GFI35210.1 NADH dehydrogenase [Bacteroidaceae bacterium]